MIRRVIVTDLASVRLKASLSSFTMVVSFLPVRNRLATKPPLVPCNSLSVVGSLSMGSGSLSKAGVEGAALGCRGSLTPLMGLAASLARLGAFCLRGLAI